MADSASGNIKIPCHVAAIMDGNGRWALKRGFPRKAGHSVGSETFKKDAEYLKSLGVRYFTVYAFSTENKGRPQDEIDEIFRLVRKYLDDACLQLLEKGIRLRFIGDIPSLPSDIQEKIAYLHNLSEQIDGMQVNIALNYGSRSEIVNACKKLIASGVEPDKLTEQDISDNLYTTGIPDPELLIRPGCERRLSNFLLWQCSYTEFYFSDVLWPDFDEKELNKAFEWYAGRKRRFGKV